MPDTDIMSSLDQDFSSVETGLPLLVDGLYEVQITEMTLKPNKTGDGQNLNIKASITQPAKDVNGKDVNPGFPVFDLIAIKKTEKYDFRPKLAEFMEATKGSKQGSFNPIEQYIGMTAQVRIKTEKDDQYGTKNRIARWVKKS